MIRFFDILFSFMGLIILSPLFIIVSIWIKVDSKGPILYKQQRVGKNNIDFYLLKFRSMRVGSDKRGLLTVGGRDPRITKFGFFIRRFKIDELPQIINVLKGEMSIVGPRPEVRKFVNYYNKEQLRILTIRPGISDLASIKYANENEILERYDNPEKAYIEIIMPDKVSLNLIYINNYNLKSYFKVILNTCLVILKKVGF
jgi:lipopolysaccharide/colanic/teichoic acid biosynthesis glycosyltransferase